MKSLLLTFVLTASVCIGSFGQNKIGNKKAAVTHPIKVVFPPPVLENPAARFPFCSLMNHQGEFIYTTALYFKIPVYTGKAKVGDFWGLHSPDKNCDTFNANLYLTDEDAIGTKYSKQLRYARKNNMPLLISIVGLLEKDNTYDEHGYIDVAPFKWRLIVKRIVDIQHEKP